MEGRSARTPEGIDIVFRHPTAVTHDQRGKTVQRLQPRVVPQAALRREIERDHIAMQGMILGDAPGFDWIMQQLARIEETVSKG